MEGARNTTCWNFGLTPVISNNLNGKDHFLVLPSKLPLAFNIYVFRPSFDFELVKSELEFKHKKMPAQGKGLIFAFVPQLSRLVRVCFKLHA